VIVHDPQTVIDPNSVTHVVICNESKRNNGRYRRLPEKESRQGVRVHIFSIAIMVFLWVKSFPLDSWFSFGFMVFLWVYGIPFSLHCSFEILLFLYSFRFGYRAICKRGVILCTKRQEVVVVGKSIFHHQHHSTCRMKANMGHLEIQEYQRLELATGPGNPPAVQVWKTKICRFGSRTVQNLTRSRLACQTSTGTRQPAGLTGFG